MVWAQAAEGGPNEVTEARAITVQELALVLPVDHT
jgi:hypothetical protein